MVFSSFLSCQVQDFETFYGMPNPGTYTVRIRARGYFTGIVSEWSAPKNFGERGTLPSPRFVCWTL